VLAHKETVMSKDDKNSGFFARLANCISPQEDFLVAAALRVVNFVVSHVYRIGDPAPIRQISISKF
jgi:hypothetical protein